MAASHAESQMKRHNSSGQLEASQPHESPPHANWPDWPQVAGIISPVLSGGRRALVCEKGGATLGVCRRQRVST